VLLTVLLYDVAPSVSFVVVTVSLRHRGCVPSWLCVGYFPISERRFLASVVVINEISRHHPPSLLHSHTLEHSNLLHHGRQRHSISLGFTCGLRGRDRGADS
jgi:hypothetical protein